MAFSNTRPLGAFPVGGFNSQDQLNVEEFKNILTAACGFALPSDKTKRYNRVKVLLTYWDEDDLHVENEVARVSDAFRLGYNYACRTEQIPARGPEAALTWMTRMLLELMTGTDSNDLLIFYYAGHGRTGKTPDEGPCILISGEYPGYHGKMVNTGLDFAAAKKPTLDTAPADVLYLLDSCYAATAGIKPGKELIAACAVESRTPGPSLKSFTAALVQELNSAVTNQYFLTAAQLFFKMLDKVHKGDLESTPVHVEAMVGPQPRTSIFLAPLGGGDTWNESPYPLTGSNRVPLGHKR
ncbi:MAG: hypothetical protein Q9221_009171, partial [Calogaya cf. arnoldii]